MGHNSADAHPGNLDDIVFPGQDYNNARVMDFKNLDNWEHNNLSRLTASRMGWQDISVSLTGPVVADGATVRH
jgi:phospholipase D1/2